MISVILPTHNRDHFLRDAVGSVFQQTYPHWELVVIDDGSTDGTPRFLGSLTDPRVVVIAHDRCGSPARLRNAGIARATGSYVAFLDSDDLWSSTKLAVQLDALVAAPECRWSFTRFDRIDHRSQPLPLPRSWAWAARSGWILENILREEVLIAMPAVMAERTLVMELGGFDESLTLCSDYDMWLRMAVRAQAVTVAAPLAKVRTHAASFTRGRDVEAHELLGRVFQKLLHEVADENLRLLVRHRYARSLVSLANFRRIAGQYRQALRALRDSVGLRRVHGAWWLALAKVLVRPMIPDRVMSRYYAWRQSRIGS